MRSGILVVGRQEGRAGCGISGMVAEDEICDTWGETVEKGQMWDPGDGGGGRE